MSYDFPTPPTKVRFAEPRLKQGGHSTDGNRRSCRGRHRDYSGRQRWDKERSMAGIDAVSGEGILLPRTSSPAGLALAAAVALAVATPASAATFRYSQSSNRIYVEGGGTATLSQIKAALPKAPLDLVDPERKIWLLRANLIVEDGSMLRIVGTAGGGDAEELRLQSDNSGLPGAIVELTADYGGIVLDATRVISWDSAAAGPDLDHANGRAFVRVRSSSLGESRMDVIDSEVGYLGYNASESYGLAWKVLATSPADFDTIQVRGNIINSYIHHNYFGVYTYGLQSALWRANEVAYNVQYGFDPHDDSDRLLVENNDIHDNGNHGFIASMRCDHLVVRGNRSYNNGGNGFMLHRSSDYGLIEENQAYDNGDSGIALFASSFNTVRRNMVLRNHKAGIRISVGADDNSIQRNRIGDGDQFGIYVYQGTDAPNAGDDGKPRRNLFAGNQVYGSAVGAIKYSDADVGTFNNNVFAGNAGHLQFMRAGKLTFVGNRFDAATVIDFSGDPDLTTDAIFASTPRVVFTQDSDATVRFSSTARNVFEVQPAAMTTVSATSSQLRLTSAQTGGAATVTTRGLTVTPSAGVVNVIPLSWGSGPGTGRQWRASLGSGSGNVQFTLTDLAAEAKYDILANGAPMQAQVRSDAAGRLVFSQVLTMAPVDFAVVPSPP
jgi:mannuronan 5-epimerase